MTRHTVTNVLLVLVVLLLAYASDRLRGIEAELIAIHVDMKQ